MMTNEQRREILEKNTIYTEMPEGWKILEGAATAPRGYKWIYNKKSIFSPERKMGLLKLYGEE